MALTRDSKETVDARLKKDPEFAKALLDEALSVFINGEPDVSRLLLRDLVNATIGFEQLAIETSKPSKSLHRMLSARGNPTMDSLTAIFNVLRKHLQVEIKVEIVSFETISLYVRTDPESFELATTEESNFTAADQKR